MNIDVLKAETRVKPSGVSFRRISPTSIVSVKRHSYGMMPMNDEFEWTHNGEKIKENDAIALLANIS